MADTGDQYAPEPRGEHGAVNRGWLRAPNLPPETALRLTTVIGAGGLTPEVFDLLRDLMRVDEDFGGDDGGELGATTCPHLTYCGTKHGGCPELTGCGHYTALAAVRAEPDTGT